MFPFGRSLCFPAEISNLVLLPLLFCSLIPSLPFVHSTYLATKMEEQRGEGRKKSTQNFTTRDLFSIFIQIFAYICLLATLPRFSLHQIKKITYLDLFCASLLGMAALLTYCDTRKSDLILMEQHLCGKLLAQAVQKHYGCSIPGSVQGEFGCGPGHPDMVPDLVVSNPACGRKLELDDL